jgi:hypothetical protein
MFKAFLSARRPKLSIAGGKLYAHHATAHDLVDALHSSAGNITPMTKTSSVICRSREAPMIAEAISRGRSIQASTIYTIVSPSILGDSVQRLYSKPAFQDAFDYSRCV